MSVHRLGHLDETAPEAVVPPHKRHLGFLSAQIPTKQAVILSLICGIVTALNQWFLPNLIGYGHTVTTTITDLLALFAFLKIGPTLGPKFRAALHLSPTVNTVIGLCLMAAMLFVQQDAGLPERAIIIGLLQTMGGLGFAPAWVPTVTLP